jgi:hypothetical protein
MQCEPLPKRILYLMARSNSKSEFAERINWPLWLWLFLGMMLGSIYLTFWAPFGHLTAGVVSLIIALVLVYSSRRSALETVVINDWLYVGNAKIEIKYIKKVVLLEKDQFLKIRGAQADPAAFNATRFWVTTGVKVEIKDRKDPTPYWLISSRKAKYLSKALN